jgi:hypothetical protein
VRCAQQVAVGAYVLDALEPDEQLAMQRHVQGCPVCAETVSELEGLPLLLAGVPVPGEAPEAPRPSELAYERFRRSAAAFAPPTAQHRRRRWIAAAAAVLVIAAAVATGEVLASHAQPVTVVAASTGLVHAEAALSAAGAGTHLAMTFEGVPFGEHCELVAVARDGREQPAGTWTVTYRGTYHWKGWVDVAPDDLAQLVVRSEDGRTLVSLSA